MRVIGRLLYFVFLALGGILFAIPKWILFGTRASRDRRKAIKLQHQALLELRKRG